MLSKVIFNSIGILIFLFLFWRRLKEDYTPSAIFTTSLYMLLGVGAAYFLSSRFFAYTWFWASFLGIVLGLLAGLAKYRMRVFETINSAAISFMPWLVLIFLFDSVTNSSLSSLVGSFIILALIALFFVLEKHYKRFSWYKSGRVGFSGLTIMGLLFLVRVAIAPIYSNVLSFSGKYEPFASGIVAFTFFLSVFNLARKSP